VCILLELVPVVALVESTLQFVLSEQYVLLLRDELCDGGNDNDGSGHGWSSLHTQNHHS
jgi:hypothetical protein